MIINSDLSTTRIYRSIEEKSQVESLLQGKLSCAKCEGKSFVVGASAQIEVEIVAYGPEKTIVEDVSHSQLSIIKVIKCKLCGGTEFSQSKEV